MNRTLIIDAFHERVIPEPNSGCWIWIGAENLGYGRVYKSANGRRTSMAHRLSYEHAKGPIPDGLTIDHLCKNTYCVNPDHLEAVTNSENVTRGNPGIRQREKTHCPSGHPYSKENTGYVGARRHRYCKACRADRKRSAA